MNIYEYHLNEYLIMTMYLILPVLAVVIPVTQPDLLDTVWQHTRSPAAETAEVTFVTREGVCENKTLDNVTKLMYVHIN